VERLWGVKKNALQIESWLKDALQVRNCGSGPATILRNGKNFTAGISLN